MARAMDFSSALLQVKAGSKIARYSWNAGGQWVAFSPGFTLGPDGIFSEPIKAHVAASGRPGTFRPYLMLHTAQGDFVPWAPTVSDVLADDWTAEE